MKNYQNSAEWADYQRKSRLEEEDMRIAEERDAALDPEVAGVCRALSEISQLAMALTYGRR